MNIRIRQARAEDAPAIAGIAEKLALRGTESSGSHRGFLMANSLETYSHFIANDDVLVLEDPDFSTVAGFSIVIGPDTIVKSGLWEKTKEIRWEPGYDRPLELETSAIYEQIALDPLYTRRLFAAYLAFVGVRRAFSRFMRLFTSVARFPIQNRASLPFLQRTGWSRIGRTDDDYPGYGRIEYDIYSLERAVYQTKLCEPDFLMLDRRVRQYMS